MEAIPSPDGDLSQRVALAELEIHVERNKLPWNTKQINRESRESNKPKGITCLLKQAPPTAPSSGTGCSPDAAAYRPTCSGARAQAPPAHRSRRQPVEEVCGGGVV